MSSKTVSTSDFVVKPIATACSTFLIDQFVFNESNYNTWLIFAASSGVGAYLGMMVDLQFLIYLILYLCF